MSSPPAERSRGAPRTVVVTGAGAGIGRALCELVVERGGRVLAVDVDRARLDEAPVRGAVPFAADIATEAGNRAMIDAAIAELGSVEAVALNAGIAASGSIEDGAVEDFDRVLAVNLRGAYLGIRAAAPALRAAGGGSIVLTASTAAVHGEPGAAAYAASKAGVASLARSAALELGTDGIRVNAVCPGPTGGTAMSAGIEERAPEVHRRLAAATALGRWATPREIASMQLVLLSDAAAYVTGAVVMVDGGITAGRPPA